MMIPIPKAGVLQEVKGLDEARSVPGIEEVTISAHVGSRLVPLPEGDRYLGFIFSRAETAGARRGRVARGARAAGVPDLAGC